MHHMAHSAKIEHWTCEQLCVSNNEICGAAVAVQAEKQHLGHGHLSPDFGI